MPDVRDLNRSAWDGLVARGNRWTVPVGPEEIEAARRGQWEIVLTPFRPVPVTWFPDLDGAKVLCLASGGGQQGPIFAAAGADVVVFDNSPRQLDQDRMVASRDGLKIETVEGDMADLGVFEDQTFDLIVHPISNCFVPNLEPVWSEAFRVLRAGGGLLAGFTNPVRYLFNEELEHSSDLLYVVNTVNKLKETPAVDKPATSTKMRIRFIVVTSDPEWPTRSSATTVHRQSTHTLPSHRPERSLLDRRRRIP